MMSKMLILILLAFFTILSVNAQPCIPDPVQEITLSEATLTWKASENCPDTEYNVIILSRGVIEYEYTVDTLTLDVSFLSFCRSYSFIIIPSSDHILGEESDIDGIIDISADADIQIQNFTADQIADDILVQWLVDDDYKYCVGYYGIVFWDEDSETPSTAYMGQNGFLVEHVAQCMNYKFQITAYYNSTNGTTAEFNYTVPEQTNPPSLVFIRQDTFVINTTWSLESYNLNRCNVTALYVNGTHFNATYPIVDTPERPTIDVSITDLKADTMYYFNVSIENTAGISRAFKMAVQTLPSEDDFD